MDAFNTCAQIKDSEDPYQQRLNTLINLGPMQAFLSRTWTPDVTDTAQQEHDQIIEAERYRRNKTNRMIRKMRDESLAADVSILAREMPVVYWRTTMDRDIVLAFSGSFRYPIYLHVCLENFSIR